ncbi:MAG: hypothetical protein HON98_11430 [Chloroflexi bacterium]|jgi:hypothetical protein|nr:hypothetical protein [Chloroflexota bacterium]MBT3670793.1 hypothetical protein [Chloroflexota bacterium]MBT4002082.1 hypothetical protein [Chloroflexota bacterium]MBT4305602.1 hypothetical protein [Chloroflexota bacterium]MBT4533317.1 hypothetical protein [Chloroflexota bacterium]
MKTKGMVVIIWLTSIVSLYYVSHFPFDVVLVSNLLLAFWQSVLAIAILIFCAALGAKISPKINTHYFAQLAVFLAFGIGITSPIYYFIGNVFGLNAYLAWFLLFLGLFLLRSQVTECANLFSQGWKDLGGGGKLGQLISWIVGGYLLFEFFIVLAPPLQFDSLVYHLTIPQQYLLNNQIQYLQENIFWGYPQAIHMLYLWFMALGGEVVALATYFVGILTLLGLWGMVSKYFGRRYAWVAVASLLGGISLVSALSTAYMGWGSILLGLSFLILLFQYKEDSNQSNAIFLGMITGIAFGIKYTNGLIFLIAFIMIMRNNPKHLLRFAIGAGIFAVPWLIKNFLATGNIAYPLIFPSGAMNAIRLSIYQGHAVDGNWFDLLFLPIRATLRGLEGAELGDAPGYLSSIGPLLLGFGVFAWFGWKKQKGEKYQILSISTWVALIGLIIWGVGGRLSWILSQTRLYYILFPAFSILAAVGYSEIEKINIGKIRVGRIASLFLIAVSVFNLSQIGVDVFRKKAPQVLFGLESTRNYLQNNLGMYALVNEVISELPEENRVLMLWETREYYCAPICEADETIDRWLSDYRSLGTPEKIIENWRAENYSHVLLYKEGQKFIQQTDDRYLESEWTALEDLLDNLPVSEEFNGIYTLYQIADE